jgi:hypothetical protein
MFFVRMLAPIIDVYPLSVEIFIDLGLPLNRFRTSHFPSDETGFSQR